MSARRAVLMAYSDDRPPAAPRSVETSVSEARLRQQAIGVKLRQMFDDVVNEPIPDEFLDILRRHDQMDRGPKAAGGSNE